MTSLIKHVSELDRALSFQQATLAAFSAAVESMAQYAVEVEPATRCQYQEHLRAINEQVRRLDGPTGLTSLQSTLRGELRDYRDRCEVHIRGLKQDLGAAMTSLHDVITSISKAENTQEDAIRTQLESLSELADSRNVEHIRAGIRTAVKTIVEYVSEMRRQNELTIVQFKDEIRMLQRRMEIEQAKASLDVETGALSRKEFETRLRREFALDRVGSFLIINITNQRDVRRRFGDRLTASAMLALFKRLSADVGDQVDIVRWNDGAFVVKLAGSREVALNTSRKLALKLSGAYSCMQDGQQYHLYLQIRFGIADAKAFHDGDTLIAKIDSLATPLA